MEEPLADQAYVIRGGLMEIVTLRIALDTSMARHGFYGLSFWGDNDLSVAQIAFLAALPNRRIRVSTVGQLRGLSLEPRRWGSYPHLVIRFEISPTDEQLREMVGAFDPDIPNPYLSD